MTYHATSFGTSTSTITTHNPSSISSFHHSHSLFPPRSSRMYYTARTSMIDIAVVWINVHIRYIPLNKVGWKVYLLIGPFYPHLSNNRSAQPPTPFRLISPFHRVSGQIHAFLLNTGSTESGSKQDQRIRKIPLGYDHLPWTGTGMGSLL